MHEARRSIDGLDKLPRLHCRTMSSAANIRPAHSTGSGANWSRLHLSASPSTIPFVKAFNLVSAVVTATVLAVATLQLTLPGQEGTPGWRIAAAWLLAALVWAVIYSFVRDGIRTTLSALVPHRRTDHRGASPT
ncbi:MAG TPA: hypothetical protein VLR27_00960 [Acidimicrobiales bacterium]|nr:hypothetical protein [Acidimicrobiales bacterium]